jgi:hypothetical protein
LKLTQEVLRTRWRILESAEGSVPRTMLIIVIFWLSMTFASFGLAAPKNATVITVFAIAALSVGAGGVPDSGTGRSAGGDHQDLERAVPVRAGQSRPVARPPAPPDV